MCVCVCYHYRHQSFPSAPPPPHHNLRASVDMAPNKPWSGSGNNGTGATTLPRGPCGGDAKGAKGKGRATSTSPAPRSCGGGIRTLPRPPPRPAPPLRPLSPPPLLPPPPICSTVFPFASRTTTDVVVSPSTVLRVVVVVSGMPSSPIVVVVLVIDDMLEPQLPPPLPLPPPPPPPPPIWELIIASNSDPNSTGAMLPPSVPSPKGDWRAGCCECCVPVYLFPRSQSSPLLLSWFSSPLRILARGERLS